MPRQLWITQVLRDAGLTVYEEDGWETRGTTTFDPIGVMWHHTASPANWSSRQLTNLLVKGHSTLKGPLCQLQLNRDGVYVVIAAGRANHAGTGSWPTIRAGNTQTIGIEAANDGVGEPWPEEQVDAYIIGTAALLKHMGQPVENIVGHKEWAPRRKIDPRGLDMDEMRSRVQAIIDAPSGGGSVPDLPPGLNWGQGGLPNILVSNTRPVLQYNSRGDDVRRAQGLLLDHGIAIGNADGQFGPRTYTGVKRFQAEKGLKIDGIIDNLTWEELEKAPIPKPSPTQKVNINNRCKTQILKRGERGNCVASLQRALNVLGHNAGTPDGSFGPKTEAAVRSFQRSNRITQDGVVGSQTWSKF
jgi:peptidoglycan hydrolase-like protein with peptidoglycan-binding domain